MPFLRNRLHVTSLLAATALLVSACDESPESAPKRRAKQALTSVESVVGTWALDAPGFVDENWKLVAAQAAPGMDQLREGEARIAKLPPSQQKAARAQVEARIAALPEEQRNMVRAALEGPEAFEATVKELLQQKLTEDALQMEFRADGTCTMSSALPGQTAHVAEGSWTATTTGLTVTISTSDGKPAKGEEAKPMAMTLRDGLLRFKPKPALPTMVARRL